MFSLFMGIQAGQKGLINSDYSRDPEIKRLKDILEQKLKQDVDPVPEDDYLKVV